MKHKKANNNSPATGNFKPETQQSLGIIIESFSCSFETSRGRDATEVTNVPPTRITSPTCNGGMVVVDLLPPPPTLSRIQKAHSSTSAVTS